MDKLVRYHRDLFRLLNNFVSFRDFYTPGPKAIFQAGTLYLDGRSCELCLRVDDIGKHSALANLSGTYLAYCDCQRRGGAEKMTIVAAFTNGDADNLMVGRHGLFFDWHGQDWDATIVKIVEHPISVRQAFWYPYKRIGKMIGEQIEKMAAAREKAVHDQAAAGVADSAQKAEAGKAPAAPFDVGKFAGIFAAIGLAVGAIGTAIASVVTGFLGLKAWQMPLALVGLVLLVSGPSMVIAYLKLRKRNLAPLLDANGWAINTRAIVNIPFGTSLTHVAALPPGAQRSFTDPYAEKKTPWKSYLFLLLLLGAIAFLWHKGHLQEWRGQVAGQGVASRRPPPRAPAAPTRRSRARRRPLQRHHAARQRQSTDHLRDLRRAVPSSRGKPGVAVRWGQWYGCRNRGASRARSIELLSRAQQQPRFFFPDRLFGRVWSTLPIGHLMAVADQGMFGVARCIRARAGRDSGVALRRPA